MFASGSQPIVQPPGEAEVLGEALRTPSAEAASEDFFFPLKVVPTFRTRIATWIKLPNGLRQEGPLGQPN